ncbi:TetR/AcrR family transcriptional regulator [Actinomycetes bacterium KLBMP 9797]
MIGITTQRRRGPELDAAILEAAWDELAAVGYARLTMEGVAARANTGKQVLYRRWRNRIELVISAIRHRWSSIADEPPDTGSVRADVLALMRRMVTRFEQLGPDLVAALIAESGEIGPDFPASMSDAMTIIVDRAATRGEVRRAALTPRVTTLPTDLLRHELLLRRHPVGEATLTEILDDIFLPLVQHHDQGVPHVVRAT